MPTHIDGDPEAMVTFAGQLTAPTMPSSLARLGTPPNLAGLFEGIAMSLLDKAATAVTAAYLTKVTGDMVTYSTKVNTAAATYSIADVTSGLDLVASGAKFAQQGISLVKQVTGSSGSSSTDSSASSTQHTGATATDSATQHTGATGADSATQQHPGTPGAHSPTHPATAGQPAAGVGGVPVQKPADQSVGNAPQRTV
ncbi:hypothetical protein [Solihabitans fulvus]|uniref:hypothetical protein n=1 Tax=Solihabitans fulvus TaxID=1892852 RepID=UPI001661D262|nr:hypothetical protein [Solihabitans fulvus]